MKMIKQFKSYEGKFFATTYTERRLGILMNVWSGDFGDMREISTVLQYSFEQLKNKNLKYWLSDVSRIDGSIEQGVQMAMADLDKVLPSSSLQKISIVSRRKNNESSRQLEALFIKYGIAVKTFPSYIQAIQWLLIPAIEATAWDESPLLEF